MGVPLPEPIRMAWFIRSNPLLLAELAAADAAVSAASVAIIVEEGRPAAE